MHFHGVLLGSQHEIWPKPYNGKVSKDLFIAAFAIHLDATVVTRNEKHFTVFSFPIENWVDD
jgi:hypothetical protein